MHGLSVKSNTKGEWDWELAASLVDYGTDQVRQSAINSAANLNGSMTSGSTANAATLTDQKGTGWNTLALKGIWRPEGVDGRHIVEFGVQRDAFKLRRRELNTGDWVGGKAGSLAAARSHRSAHLRERLQPLRQHMRAQPGFP
jgi:iron complex outermembrane receptor protein